MAFALLFFVLLAPNLGEEFPHSCYLLINDLYSLVESSH